MPFNTAEFRAKLARGGARPALFRVTVQPASTVPGAFPTQQFSFMCRSASLPASTIGHIEVPYFGKVIKVAGDRSFDEWSTTIINDETFDIRNAFEKWQSAINFIDGETNAQRNNGITSAPSSYVATLTVEQFAKTGGSPIKKYTFKNAFPVLVGSIDLDWDAKDAIENFEVVWAYDYFVPTAV